MLRRRTRAKSHFSRLANGRTRSAKCILCVGIPTRAFFPVIYCFSSAFFLPFFSPFSFKFHGASRPAQGKSVQFFELSRNPRPIESGLPIQRIYKTFKVVYRNNVTRVALNVLRVLRSGAPHIIDRREGNNYYIYGHSFSQCVQYTRIDI